MAKVFQTDVILKLIDRLSGPLGIAAKSIERSNLGIARSFRVLNSTSSRMAFGLAGTSLAITAMEKLGRRAVEISRLRNEIAAASIEATKVPGGGFTLTGLTPQEEGIAATKAIEASRKYGLAVEEFLKASNELIRAGIPRKVAALDMGASAVVAMAAKINKIDTGEMAERMSSIATIFKRDLPTGTIDQAAKSFQTIGDTIAYFETQAPGRGKHLLDTLKFAGPIMSQSGLNLRQVTEMAIGLAKSYQLGSEAGVAFRSMMVGMIKPTKQAREALQKYDLAHSQFVKKVPITGERIGKILQSEFEGFDPSKHKGALDKVASLKDFAKRKKAMEELAKTVPEMIGADPERVTAAINDSLMLAVQEVDFIGFLKALREKGATAADLVKIFEGRQISRSLTAMKEVMDAMGRMDVPITGILSEQFEKTMRGLSGAVTQFDSSLSQLAAAFEKSAAGKIVEEGIRGLATAVSELAKAFESASPEMQKFALAATALAAIGGATVAWRGVSKLLLGAGRMAAGGALAGAGAGAAAGAAGAAATGGAAAAASKLPGWLKFGGPLGVALLAWQNRLSKEDLSKSLSIDYQRPAWAKGGLPDKAAGGKMFDPSMARMAPELKKAADAADDYWTSVAEAEVKSKALVATQSAITTWSGIVKGAISEISGTIGSLSSQFQGLTNSINGTGSAIDSLGKRSNALSNIKAAAAKSVAPAAPAGAGGNARIDVALTTDANTNVGSVRSSGALPHTKVALRHRGRILSEVA